MAVRPLRPAALDRERHACRARRPRLGGARSTAAGSPGPSTPARPSEGTGSRAINDGWRPYALEINLHCGGTTHPLSALTTLPDGVYDALAGEYRTRYGEIRHCAATDHLDSPAYRSLTPDDLLDVVAEKELGRHGERGTGVALHVISAIAVAGRIGLTAIGDTLEESRGRY